ncbi:MAG: serine hydrolase domain-containing protein [bacterium]
MLPRGAPAQTAVAFPPDTPENQGLSSAALHELAGEIQQYLDEDSILGAEFLVIKNRRTVFHEVFGWKDRDDQTPMERNTLFNIRSMTKPVTGAAAQILIDEGRLSLEDPVSTYIPGFLNGRSAEATIDQLLTHRSGLPLSILTRLDEYSSLYDMANAIGEKGPQFSPGTKFWYSDAGSEALGAVGEVASGMGLEAFVNQRLLGPLGMSDSFYQMPADDPRWERVASDYASSQGEWIRFYKPGGKSMYPFAWGSQSLYSTPADYAKFLAMWMDRGLALNGQRILSADAVTRTLAPVSAMTQLNSNAPMPSGFPGLNVFYGRLAIVYMERAASSPQNPIVIGHSGSDGTWAWAWPELDLIVLYFTQSRGTISGIRLETVIDQKLIHPSGSGTIPKEQKPYLGNYLANYGPFQNAEFKVVSVNGFLMLDIPTQIIFELREPDSRGVWKFVLDGNMGISFVEDNTGTVTGLRFQEYGSTAYMPKIQETPVADWILLE